MAADDGTQAWENAEHATVNQYSPDDQLLTTQLPWGSEGDGSDPNGVDQAAENRERYVDDRRLARAQGDPRLQRARF